MTAKFGNGSLWGHALRIGLVVSALATLGTACKEGVITDSIDDESERDLSGIAGPPGETILAPELHDRATWGGGLNADALAYPNSTGDERSLFDMGDTESPLHFFATEHQDNEGVGPLFNQRRCLGCHDNSEHNGRMLAAGVPNPGGILGVNTPVSRAGRQGLTDPAKITKATGNPPTSAFMLYGDYTPSTGAFTPIPELGGPLRHINAVGVCKINDLPPMSVDPHLGGEVRRAVGERAAPPYIGRGLMEAVWYEDIVANDDPADTFKGNSSLPPQPDPTICTGDCISGRHNEGRASDSFTGGDTVIRVSRFGLRGAGPALLAFPIGGATGEIGLTTPFSPTEQPDVDNPNVQCDTVPDPEISADTVLKCRDLIRNIAPPRQADSLYEDPPVSQEAKDVQAGAKLFGVDLAAFRSRMTANATRVGSGPDADHAIAADRQLGCASCHIPVLRTGHSPAKIGGGHLSNRWAPLFSDLLIHQNPSLPPGAPAGLIPGSINRDLSDGVIPGSVSGLAGPDEFRTPPLMGLGRTGPPFFHDARVFLNPIGTGSYPGDPPNPPATTVFTSADEGTTLKQITTFELAVLAAIEVHDLPAPPGNDYANCPNVPPAQDICSRGSPYRGEARNTMEKFRALTSAEQLQVVRFLLAL
jgi:CxxC motif-containing protein (DUF1111 family)